MKIFLVLSFLASILSMSANASSVYSCTAICAEKKGFVGIDESFSSITVSVLGRSKNEVIEKLDKKCAQIIENGYIVNGNLHSLKTTAPTTDGRHYFLSESFPKLGIIGAEESFEANCDSIEL